MDARRGISGARHLNQRRPSDHVPLGRCCTFNGLFMGLRTRPGALAPIGQPMKQAISGLTSGLPRVVEGILFAPTPTGADTVLARCLPLPVCLDHRCSHIAWIAKWVGAVWTNISAHVATGSTVARLVVGAGAWMTGGVVGGAALLNDQGSDPCGHESSLHVL
jgi:hypothetical protein